ncbi:MAG: type IV pilus biogenesis/stability protein PilW [Pseudomonadota bacterium]
MSRVVSVSLLLLLLLGGCVTESTGGLPDPAPEADRVQAQLDLARGYLEQGNIERARTSLNKALEIDSRSVEAHTLFGVLYSAESEWGVAERHFRTALELDSRDAMALNNYGSFLYARERYDEAVGYLRTLVQNTDYRARSQAYENLGLAELKIDERDAARESFNRALQLSFSQPQSSIELAQLAYEDGDIVSAAQYYDTFRSQAPQTARSLCLGMKISQEQGNSDQMASYALALNNLFPSAPETSQCIVPR